MKKIYISWQVNLIQQVRLIHALAESNYDVTVSAAELDKFAELVRKFDIKLHHSGTDQCDVTEDLRMSHQEPATSVGRIERPLIFPHGAIEECRRIWSLERMTQVGFSGLITSKRAKLITDWIHLNTKVKNPSLPNPNSFSNRAINKVKRTLGIPTGFKRQIGPLLLSHSSRGREFPIKAWDQEYFESLGDTQFTLCPSGDCVWSYRFFEAMLCGSIPIVEGTCPLYEGFKFYSFDDCLDSLKWDEEIALHNYEKCKEMLTIDPEELNGEISKLIKCKANDVS
jgi:hypothetical protein